MALDKQRKPVSLPSAGWTLVEIQDHDPEQDSSSETKQDFVEEQEPMKTDPVPKGSVEPTPEPISEREVQTLEAIPSPAEESPSVEEDVAKADEQEKSVQASEEDSPKSEELREETTQEPAPDEDDEVSETDAEENPTDSIDEETSRERDASENDETNDEEERSSEFVSDATETEKAEGDDKTLDEVEATEDTSIPEPAGEPDSDDSDEENDEKEEKADGKENLDSGTKTEEEPTEDKAETKAADSEETDEDTSFTSRESRRREAPVFRQRWTAPQTLDENEDSSDDSKNKVAQKPAAETASIRPSWHQPSYGVSHEEDASSSSPDKRDDYPKPEEEPTGTDEGDKHTESASEPWQNPPEEDALVDRYLTHPSGLRVERGAHWWVLALLVLLGGLFGKAALLETLPLSGAEALVASRSLAPALATVDAPGMAFWLTYLGTKLVGDGLLGVRLFGWIAWFGTGLFLFLLGRSLLRSDRLGFYALLLYGVSPAFEVLGMGPSPMAFLFFFWSGALFFLFTAAKQGEDRWFIPMGVFLAGAIASHYLAVIFYPLMLLYLAWAGKLGSLFKKGTLIGVGVSLAGAVPTIVWNVPLKFAPLWVQFVSRHEGAHFNPARAAEVFLPWALGLNPLLLLLLAAGALLALKHTFDRFDPHTALVPVFGLLTTLFLLGLGLWSPTGEGSWPLLGLLPLFLYGGLMLTKFPAKLPTLGVWLVTVGLSLAMLGLLGTHVVTDSLVKPLARIITPEQDPTRPLWGFKELARAVKKRKTGLSGSGFLFSDDPAFCAQLRSNLKSSLPVFCLTAKPGVAESAGLRPPLSRDGLYITDEAKTNPRKLYQCRRLAQAGRETIRRGGQVVRTFYLYRCLGYQGLNGSGSDRPLDDGMDQHPVALPNEARPDDTPAPATTQDFVPADAQPAQDAVELPLDQPGSVTPPANAQADQPGSATPPANSQADQPGSATPPANAQANQPGSVTPPANAQADQPGSATPPANAQANQPGSVTPPANAQANQPGSAMPPANSQPATPPTPPAAEPSLEAGEEIEL